MEKLAATHRSGFGLPSHIAETAVLLQGTGNVEFSKEFCL
jgi:hypothetical protein